MLDLQGIEGENDDEGRERLARWQQRVAYLFLLI